MFPQLQVLVLLFQSVVTLQMKPFLLIMRVSREFLISLISLLTRATHLSDRCKVWVRLSLGIKQYRPRDTVSAPASHWPLVARHAPALSTYTLPAPSRRPPSVFAACHLRSSLDRCFPPRSQVDLAVAPQNHRPRLKHRPRRIGRHQNARHRCST